MMQSQNLEDIRLKNMMPLFKVQFFNINFSFCFERGRGGVGVQKRPSLSFRRNNKIGCCTIKQVTETQQDIVFSRQCCLHLLVRQTIGLSQTTIQNQTSLLHGVSYFRHNLFRYLYLIIVYFILTRGNDTDMSMITGIV